MAALEVKFLDRRQTTKAKAFVKNVFINQERKLEVRRRSDTALVLTINDALPLHPPSHPSSIPLLLLYPIQLHPIRHHEDGGASRSSHFGLCGRLQDAAQEGLSV